MNSKIQDLLSQLEDEIRQFGEDRLEAGVEAGDSEGYDRGYADGFEAGKADADEEEE